MMTDALSEVVRHVSWYLHPYGYADKGATMRSLLTWIEEAIKESQWRSYRAKGR